MKNKFIAIFMALTFCFLSSFCFCSVGSSDIVYAAETFDIPLESFSYNVSDSLIEPIIESAYNKTIAIENNYEPENSFFFFNSQNVFLVLKDDIVTTSRQFAYYYGSTWIYRPMLIFSKGIQFNSNASNSGSLFTSVQSGNVTTYGIVDVNPNPFNYSRYYVGGLYYDSNYGHYSTLQLNSNLPTYFETSYTPPFVPLPTTFYGLDLSINETSFYEWIIENNKLSELPSYITQAKLLSFISFYNEFGGNFGNFLKNIPDWFSHMNILNQTTENVNILKSSMDRLYQEYLNSFWREVGYGNAALLPHHRRNIQTQTTDDDTRLITDDSTDTLDISILRDILRGIIQVSNQIGDGTNSIINKLDQLDFTVNLTNGGGSSVTDLSVLYEYDINEFNDDFTTFEENVSDITAVPLSYVQTINNNSLMPENMLSDKQSLTVNIPVINGFTVNSDGTQYETNTDTYTLNSTDYPWLDTIVKKMKRFASIMLIIGYLIHLRFKIADIVRGE